MPLVELRELIGVFQRRGVAKESEAHIQARHHCSPHERRYIQDVLAHNAAIDVGPRCCDNPERAILDSLLSLAILACKDTDGKVLSMRRWYYALRMAGSPYLSLSMRFPLRLKGNLM